jgi:deazaflavin-dependent oxidoreductase (nitroreductase family)
MDYRSAGDRAWPVLNQLVKVHVFAYRTSGGRLGHRLPGLPQMVLLDHVGAKSGTKRTSPLVYAADGENIVLVASKGGHPLHPAWFHNLKANPDTTVQIGSELRPVRARVATATERKRLWPLATAVYSGFDTYQKRADREIPVVVLEPR